MCKRAKQCAYKSESSVLEPFQLVTRDRLVQGKGMKPTLLKK